MAWYKLIFKSITKFSGREVRAKQLVDTMLGKKFQSKGFPGRGVTKDVSARDGK
jgi:hypothetical protein